MYSFWKNFIDNLKVIKTFSIPDKTFLKNSILLCALSKILQKNCNI